VLSNLKAAPASIPEVERRLRNTDGVLRFLTVRIDEQKGKEERRKARRDEKDVARRDRKVKKAREADAAASASTKAPAPAATSRPASPEAAAETSGAQES